MPIFTQSLQRIDTANPQDAIKKLYNHIKYIQEQLEYTLLNLDSHNINEIDMTDSQRQNVIHKIFMWYKKHPGHLNDLLQYFIEANAEDYDMSKPCEQCGDCVCTYKITI